jgi:ATP-dependent Clp protease ATP-binding subunit ClpA
LIGKYSENTQKILDHANRVAARMGPEMVGTQHVLWALFDIDDKAKPRIRNWLEMNIGVTKEKVFETFQQLTPDF